MPAGPVDHRPDVRLAWALGTIVVVATLAPVVVLLVFGDRLPLEVPRHYGPDGRPTALWPRGTSVAFVSTMTLLVGGGCAAACVLLRLPLVARRMLAWTVTWVTALLSGLKVGALLLLLDTTDPMAAGSISGSATVALVAGALLGVPVAALAREAPHGRDAEGPPPPTLPRRRSDDAGDGATDADAPELTWRSAPLTSRALILVLVLAGATLLVPAAFIGPFGEGAWLVLLSLLALGPAAVFARLRTHVDADGLRVRGTGVQLLHIPIPEVAAADVVDHVDPFWEFGGWGLRVDVHGRTGVVSRAGEALRVTRGDDTQVLITVDDAASAAATLNSLADRHHLD